MSTTSIQLPFFQGKEMARAARKIASAVRNGEDFAVLIVHVLGVERLCASIGHQEAGSILDGFFGELRTIARENDAVERIGDRKFLVVLHGLRNRGHVSLAAQKIERIAAKCASTEIQKNLLKASVGIAMFPERREDEFELMRLAEVASLDGQQKGESISFYEPQSAERLVMDWGLEDRLSRALESGDLDLHFQPQISCETGNIIGAEALMRWNEPEIGAISPDVFIELAESTGQIAELTHFAIQQACRHLGKWQDWFPDFNVAVNVTPSTIQNMDIVDTIKSASSIWGVSPGALTIEVTENALMTDRESSHAVLTRIRDFGARVSIDDFGTGYSSFAYLKELPADELKIDRSFVMGMLTDESDRKIVEHSIGIAKSFGLHVVAEGVEDAESLHYLRKLECDIAQGYFICKPLPADEFEAFCRKSVGIEEQVD